MIHHIEQQKSAKVVLGIPTSRLEKATLQVELDQSVPLQSIKACGERILEISISDQQNRYEEAGERRGKSVNQRESRSTHVPSITHLLPNF